jgi:hypothetical protein
MGFDPQEKFMASNGKGMDSMPMHGTREKSDMPENSGHKYPSHTPPAAEAVREAKHNPAARKKARGFNERSEAGNANPSAYPCE